MRVGRAFLLALLAACGDSSEGSHVRPEAISPDPGPDPSPPGPDPFDESVVALYEIAIRPADWNAMVADPHDNTWRRCTVVWGGETYEDVAIRPSGERSRIPGNPKPSLRLEFDEFVADREFHGFSSLKLDSMIHDDTLMKARLEYPVYAARGVPAPRYVHCRLHVNGENKGVYGVEERVSREFVRKRLGHPVEQLYEWGHSDDLIWAGPEPISQYVPRMWEPEIEELPSGAAGVRDLVDAVNNDLAGLPSRFDIESFLNFIAVETVLGEGDGYVARANGESTANIYLYRSPATGLYLLLPWDRDQGFWKQDHGITHGFENRILTRNVILADPDRRSRYQAILLELIDGSYRTELMQARVDFVYRQIRDAVYEDPLKPYTNSRFDSSVGRLQRYIEERNAAFRSQLSAP